MIGLARLTGAVVLTAALVFGVSACSTGRTDGGAGQANQQGYVGSTPVVTEISPADRVAQPAVAGQSLDGKPLSTADYVGKVLVVNVWGSWCSPCREEAPGLQQASTETAKVAQFLGINTRDYDPAPAQAFIRANAITYPSIYDPDGTTLLAFTKTAPAKAIPTTLIIDRQGRLAVRILGPISKITLVTVINSVAKT